MRLINGVWPKCLTHSFPQLLDVPPYFFTGLLFISYLLTYLLFTLTLTSCVTFDRPQVFIHMLQVSRGHSNNVQTNFIHSLATHDWFSTIISSSLIHMLYHSLQSIILTSFRKQCVYAFLWPPVPLPDLYRRHERSSLITISSYNFPCSHKVSHTTQEHRIFALSWVQQ